MCRLSWFLDPGGWDKAAAVGLYFIFPGICTLSLIPMILIAGLVTEVECTLYNNEEKKGEARGDFLKPYFNEASLIKIKSSTNPWL
ncbi:hypothetical protein STEG23_002873 [Scotinomys teguina]